MSGRAHKFAYLMKCEAHGIGDANRSRGLAERFKQRV